ncbi:MAG TPA: NADH-quinone oxidoreductase subunit N [Verrucomicrobiae bacterium]|jgi:NADH-quinone oxidoreductase subunit N|nr:NADH-quinone oxidoreductase subunit N [Verrucomicrobiae bacterium]
MSLAMVSLELAVIGLALAVLLIDLWTPRELRHLLGYLAAAGLLVILAASWISGSDPSEVGISRIGFSGMFVQDGLAVFFKRIFLAIGVMVVLMGVEFRERIPMGIGEFFAITLIALAGMMFAASANDFVMVYVAMELMAACFYILVSFQRSRSNSLEAGVKYLILSALSAGLLVFGIALIFGTSGGTNFAFVAAAGARLAENNLFCLGTLLVLLGLAFKISAVPMQMWAPDVYQGAPTPVTALLAISSKTAGFVLVLRVLFAAAPALSLHWHKLFTCAAAFTILYGNLCAIPQRSLKRLLGYSSIAHSGYLLLGVAALNDSGSVAILYYLAGYAFTLAAIFIVLCLVARDNDDISVLAGLNRRSPILALAMTLGMVSLAGIPPMAGFFGKLLLFKSVLAQAAIHQSYLWLTLVAIVGVVISYYYYFGVIRAIYWSEEGSDMSPIAISAPLKFSVVVCIAAMFYLGLCPDAALSAATKAVQALRF